MSMNTSVSNQIQYIKDSYTYKKLLLHGHLSGDYVPCMLEETYYEGIKDWAVGTFDLSKPVLLDPSYFDPSTAHARVIGFYLQGSESVITSGVCDVRTFVATKCSLNTDDEDFLSSL